jgi:hypothetical protein
MTKEFISEKLYTYSDKLFFYTKFGNITNSLTVAGIRTDPISIHTTCFFPPEGYTSSRRTLM